MNKPDPMAEDELDELLETIGIKFTVASNDEWFDKRKSEAKAAINTYTTNKIIEARIDELDKLHDLFYLFYKPGYEDSIITPRIAELKEALNHRKDK